VRWLTQPHPFNALIFRQLKAPEIQPAWLHLGLGSRVRQPAYMIIPAYICQAESGFRGHLVFKAQKGYNIL
jgi:hypothetical protein